MTACWICLDQAPDNRRYHANCLKRLFGRPLCPRVDLGPTTLTEAIATQSDQISISGVQAKLIVEVTDDGKAVRPAENGHYILKAPVEAFKHLPQNEHLTMALGGMAGLVVPPFGLIELPDRGIAYIVKRFDRTDDHVRAKRRQEDFCSLLQRDPTLKYQASAEECVDVVRRYTADVDSDLRRLFRQFLFAFWIGNDDLHLKNLSLAQHGTEGYALSPAYDLVCTRLYPQLKKGMALSLGGVKLHHQRSHFIAFAAHCGIGADEAHAEIDRLRDKVDEAGSLVVRSALPVPFQQSYKHELTKKNRALERGRAARRSGTRTPTR